MSVLEGSVMKKEMYILLSVVFVLMFSSTVHAQDFEYHPGLSDNFTVVLGAFKSSNTFDISAEGSIEDEIEDTIDFGKSTGVDENSTLFNAQLRWKFGKTRKWSIWGQYFSNDATGEAFLTEDVEWQDVVFREGTFVEAGVDLAVTRIFIGRSLVKNQQHDFGIGAGIHNLDLSVFIEGDIKIDDDSTDFFRGDSENSQPLPNIGAWYHFSPARKWLIHTRVDWISAEIGDYDGTLWNANIGVNYQAFRHVSFDVSYQYFELDLKINKSDWQGAVDMTYSGPMLSVQFNW
jgi:hypothetical protein